MGHLSFLLTQWGCFKNKISTFRWLLIVMDEKNLKITVLYFVFLLYESLLERKTFTSSKINVLFQWDQAFQWYSFESNITLLGPIGKQTEDWVDVHTHLVYRHSRAPIYHPPFSCHPLSFSESGRYSSDYTVRDQFNPGHHI